MHQLTVMTLEGKRFPVNVADHTTTRNLLNTVAAAINHPADELRVAYAGQELNCNQDLPFNYNPNCPVLHVVRRMTGGGGGAAAELAKQFRRIMQNPLPGISAAPNGGRPNDLLTGPRGTPYEGGWFDVKLNFPSDFPYSMPVGEFETPIWHPNVGSNGMICISMVRDSTSDCAVECVLMALHMLLATPNPDSPLNSECARQYKRDYEQYRRQAAQMTRERAM